MALAHEIAVDKDFTLQKIQPANAVEKQALHEYIINRYSFETRICHHFHMLIMHMSGERDYAEGFLGSSSAAA